MADEAGTLTSSPSTALHSRHPRRVKLSEQQLETVNHDELLRNWRELDSYVDILESQLPTQEEFSALRKSEDRLRQQYLESTHREKVLVRRLAAKEQEMQEYVSQITELKAAQAPGAAALRSALLDPAVNLLLQRLRQELLATRARLEETQNELSAWKFTPDSNTGKRLMAKCRLLYQENEELGRMINSGRLAKLEGDLALQKSFSEEVKKSQSELDEFLQDLDEDVEGMQGTIYYLQQELRKAKDAVISLQQENAFLKSGSAAKDAGQIEEEGDSEVGGASRSRTPVLCDNETQQKVEDDSRDWETQTGPNQAGLRDLPSKLQSPHSEQPVGDISNSNTEVTNKQVTEQSGSTNDIRTTSAASKENEDRKGIYANIQSGTPVLESGDRTHTFNDDSSDSGELILKLDSEDIGEEEIESRDSTNTMAKKGKQERSEAESQIKNKKPEERTEHLSGSPDAPRKRNYQSDDSSGDDSDNVPLIKKVRRDSEISLHYNEDDDETGLTNGNANAPGNATQ